MGNRESSESPEQKQKKPDFKYIDGRRYHNEETASYLLSSDIEEIDRQQLQHYCFKHIFKCNISAPVEPMLKEGGCKVLDVGCGAGIWVLELSTEFPKSEFIGLDMSPVFPAQIKPINSSFTKVNIMDGLPFPSEEFDYVHLSFMQACFNDDQWQNIVLPELVRVLKPNGWLEFYEVDVIQFSGGPLVSRLTDSVQKFISSAGLNPRLPNLFKQWLSSYKCLGAMDEIVVYPFIGDWKGDVIDEEIDGDSAGKHEMGSTGYKENDITIMSEEGDNSDVNYSAKNTNIKSKDDVEIGVLLKQVLKLYYIGDSEHLSKCAGVSKEEYLDIVEECFEREMLEYDTRMKFFRIICRKEAEEI